LKLKETVALVPLDRPEVLGYANLFEEGDLWIKIKGCLDCPESSRQMCCRDCKAKYIYGCMFHLEGGTTNKPFECVVKPDPRQGLSYCHLEFLCVSGTRVGKIRRIKDSLDIING